MLKELYIENLAVIEKANINFTNNFNVFTGETGAGKSILINGINAILGQRITKDIVRTGTSKAVISALFTNVDEKIYSKINEYGITVDKEENQLFLTREISSDGGSIARINSRSINISVLREIGNMLINIHGQHDNQILMSPENHIHILDNYANLQSFIDDYKSSFKELQIMAKKIRKVKLESEKKEEKINDLKEIINELTALNINPEVDNKIEDELEILKNSSVLSEALFNANQIISGNDNISGISELISNANDFILHHIDIMPELDNIAERLSSVQIELNDISSELELKIDKLNFNPNRYDYLNQRYDELRKIKKKYGLEINDVLSLLEKSKNELEILLSSDRCYSELNEAMKEKLSIVSKKAKKLSELRTKAAKQFCIQVSQELEFLNMPKVRIEVDIKPGKLTIDGMDNIEFLISANVGEELKSIAKVASGGELSRIMLALKNVIADKDDVNTLIFDEIDTGVSGYTAQKIGLKLKQISKIRQVLCVTHLAQIAVMADNHILIEKNMIDNRTLTKVKELNNDQRKFEIARIMNGDNPTELMLLNAQQLLDKYKS